MSYITLVTGVSVLMSLPSRPSLFASGDVATWLERFGHIATANDWKPEDWATLLPAYLDGQALAVFLDCPTMTKKTTRKSKLHFWKPSEARSSWP